MISCSVIIIITHVYTHYYQTEHKKQSLAAAVSQPRDIFKLTGSQLREGAEGSGVGGRTIVPSSPDLRILHSSVQLTASCVVLNVSGAAEKFSDRYIME